MKTLLTSTGLALILAMSPAAVPTALSAEGVVESQAEGQWLATELLGKDVRGENDDSIGQISDIVVDEDGNFVAVVIGAGAGLGIGERNVALEYDRLDISREDGRLEISTQMTASELEEAPEFERLEAAELSPGQPMGAPGAPGAPETPGVTPGAQDTSPSESSSPGLSPSPDASPNTPASPAEPQQPL